MDIRITVDGKRVLTVELGAARYGLTAKALGVALTRAKGQPGATPIAYLDGRKPLYLMTELDALIRNRPGKGAPNVPRPHRLKRDQALG